MIRSRVWKYGDDVNTDVIYPGKYLYTILDAQEMAKHALEDLDPAFAENVKNGDIIVAGTNFGCGSSREQAATCIKYAGVSAVVAKSFSRIFFRNAINQGLLAIECPEAVDKIENGAEITIDLENGKIQCDMETFSFPAFPESVLGILKDGGLVPHLKKLGRKEKA